MTLYRLSELGWYNKLNVQNHIFHKRALISHGRLGRLWKKISGLIWLGTETFWESPFLTHRPYQGTLAGELVYNEILKT